MWHVLKSYPVVLVLAAAFFAAAAFAGVHYYSTVVTPKKATPQILATSTEAVATSTPDTEVEVKAKLPISTPPTTIYIPVQTQAPTQPTVEITNGVKNEGSGTVNVYNPPQTTAPIQTEVFVEPRTMTTLEVARDIVKLYDANGTAELYGDNKIRVTAFGGRSVTLDLVTGWEENLKLTLRKIK